MHKKLDIFLAQTHGSQKEVCKQVSFLIHPSDIAQKWATLVSRALKEGALLERERFYNLNDNTRDTLQECILQTEDILREISQRNTSIDFGKIDFANPQNEINRLLKNFVYPALSNKFTTLHNNERHLQTWNSLNVALHKLEVLLGSLNKSEENKITDAKIVVTFQKPGFIELTADDLENTHLNTHFGNCYLNYSQIGRHIRELYFANDLNMPTELIQPFRYMSANFFIWLGQTMGNAYHVELEKKIELWFNENKRIFQDAGLTWEDCRPTLGRIAVATLEKPLYSISQIDSFKNELKNYQKIIDISIE